MIDRSLSIAVAAGALVLTAMMPQQASALPRVGVDTQAAPALVQQAGTRYFAATIAAPEVMCERPSPRWIRGAVPGSLLPSRASIQGGAARGCGRRS